MLPDELPDGRAPLFVITGFLGSGKTTLLNGLLSHPETRDTAVLINEFGEIGIDNLLVSEIRENLVLLESGCVCCSVLDDLSGAIKDLFAKREARDIPYFKRLVLETTGLADPAPIVHTLMDEAAMSLLIYLDSVIATVDGVLGKRELEEHDEALKQAIVADRLVVTKSDLADPAEIALLMERLSGLNPGAPILRVVGGKISPEELLGGGMQTIGHTRKGVSEWLHDEAIHAAGTRPHAEIGTFAVRVETPIVWRAFTRWVGATLDRCGDRVLRLKAVLNVKDFDQPRVFQAVQRVIYPTVSLPAWPDADRSSRIVAITRGLPPDEVAGLKRELETALGLRA